jgi:AraC-like DNA-binding protein/multidrug transporter EmrE-like cation transporter
MAYGFYFSDIFLQCPHLWRTPVFLSLCTPPVSFLYIRTVINQEFKFKRTDLWFLLPAVLYTANYIPFYLLPAEKKLVYIKIALVDISNFAKENETWIRIPGAVLFRLGFGVSLLFLGLKHIIRWKKSLKMSDIPKQNKDLYRWLLFYTVIMFAAYLFLFIEYSFHMVEKSTAYGLFTIIVSITIVLICIYLLIRPNILYGASGWPHGHMLNIHKHTPADLKSNDTPSRPSISYEQGLYYKQLLEEHMLQTNPFLKQGYSIRDLSLELKIPTHQLSVFINQEYSKNFNELINEYRIQYLTSLYSNHDQYNQYTLDALSKLGGFNSRSSFIAAVKKYTGQTPSEFFSRK